MAITKRVSPRQHYHVQVCRVADGAKTTARIGAHRYDQGRDGSNAAARLLAQAEARVGGARAEARRIDCGIWTAITWNKAADDFTTPGDWEIEASAYFTSRVCFTPDCQPG